MQALHEYVAVITGAGRGIGRGIAEVIASEGARVIVADIDEMAATQVAEQISGTGVEAIACAVDVTNRASTKDLADFATQTWGRIDIVAANAGIYPQADFLSAQEQVWERVMNVNLFGARNILQACLPQMIRRRYGRAILTSSITGAITGQVGLAHYGASKAAMLGLMRSLAVEYADSGVTVNAVMPGNVWTPGLEQVPQEFRDQLLASIPMGRFGTPHDVGWAVRFLASPEAAYITGQTIVIDGGQVLPE